MAIVGGLDGPCGKRKGTYEVGTTLDGLSPYGAMDMSGNVWEWVADAFETYGKVEATDPFVPPRGNARGVIRGGSWDYSAIVAKTSVRLPMGPRLGAAEHRVPLRALKRAAAPRGPAAPVAPASIRTRAKAAAARCPFHRVGAPLPPGQKPLQTTPVTC
jgi:hypothetical protein